MVRNSIPRRIKRFLVSLPSSPALEPPYAMDIEAVSPGYEADHSPRTSAQVTTPPTSSWLSA
jgi:hypothetical protein